MAGARPPDAAAARRFCALPRDLQGSAGRTREGPCGGCGRAAGSAGANAHGRVCRSARPWPRVRIVPVHGRRGVRGGGTGRRFFTPHPKPARSHRFCARPPRRAQFRPRPCAAEGRAGASPPHIPWPRVRVVSVHDRRGRARRRDGLALPHPTSHGRAFASFLCTIAAGVRRLRDGPALPHPTSPGRAFAALLCTAAAACAVPAAGVRRRRDGPALLHPTSHGRGRSRRSNSYRARGGFAPTAAVRRRRAPLRSRSAPRAGRGPRGRSGRRPRSAGRWGGAGRASR